jgi:hypothetical protein
MDARRANERIAEKAERFRFVSRVPMLCECSTPGCRSVFMIGLAEYREIREGDALIVAPGHAAEGAELDRREADYDIHRLRGGGESDGDRRSA